MFFETQREGRVFTAIPTNAEIDTFYLEASHRTSVLWNILLKTLKASRMVSNKNM